MLNKAYVKLFAVFLCSFAGTFAVRPSTSLTQPPHSPCNIEGQNFDTAAFDRVRTVLTYTGDVGIDNAAIRDTLGIAGVRIEDVVVVTDTILCRRALNAWKAFFPSYGPKEAQAAVQTTGGLLLRLAPNRYALALAVFDPWTIATFFVTDSNFVMVKPWM